MLADQTLFASLPAEDVARARGWYHDKLGLDPVEEDQGGNLWYEAGESRFLMYQSAFAGTNQATAAGWNVEDLMAVAGELKGRGVVFEDYDMGEFATKDGVLTLPDGSLASWFKDSEGNILSLFQQA